MDMENIHETLKRMIKRKALEKGINVEGFVTYRGRWYYVNFPEDIIVEQSLRR